MDTSEPQQFPKKSRFNIAIRVIAAVLIVSFLAYDITWAYPDAGTDTLAVTGLKNKDALARLKALLIVDLIEKRSALRDNLVSVRLDDIFAWQRLSANEKEFEGVSFVPSYDSQHQLNEVTLSLNNGDILIRYFNPRSLQRRTTPAGYHDITREVTGSATYALHPEQETSVYRQILRRASTSPTTATPAIDVGQMPAQPSPAAADNYAVARLHESIETIRNLRRETTVLFVIPVFNEMERLSAGNALEKKVEELQSLARINPFFRWQLLIVDDGTPDAASAACARREWERIRSLYLQEKNEPLLRDKVIITSLTADEKKLSQSRKGGAVHKGFAMALAAQEVWHADYIGYTDIDNATDLRQTGLLLAPLVDGTAQVAIASRWGHYRHSLHTHPFKTLWSAETIRVIASAVYTQYVRRIMPLLRDIDDTQRGFKLFARAALQDISSYTEDASFSFDTELLLLARLAGYTIRQAPIAWYDVPGSTVRLSSDSRTMFRNVYAQRGFLYNAIRFRWYLWRLKSLSPDTRYAAVHAIGRLGVALRAQEHQSARRLAIYRISRMLADPVAEVRIEAERALVKLGASHAEMVTAYRRNLSARIPGVRVHALRRLGELDETGLKEVILGLLSDTNKEVREAALDVARTLGASNEEIAARLQRVQQNAAFSEARLFAQRELEGRGSRALAPVVQPFAKLKTSFFGTVALIVAGLIACVVAQCFLSVHWSFVVIVVALPLVQWGVDEYISNGALLQRTNIFAGLAPSQADAKKEEILARLLQLLELHNPELRNPQVPDPAHRDPFIREVRIVDDLYGRVAEFKPAGRVFEIHADFFTSDEPERLFDRFRALYIHERAHAKRLHERYYMPAENVGELMWDEITSRYAEYVAIYKYRSWALVKPLVVLMAYIAIAAYIYKLCVFCSAIALPQIIRVISLAIIEAYYRRMRADPPAVATSFKVTTKLRFERIVKEKFNRVVQRVMKSKEVLREYLFEGGFDERLWRAYRAVMKDLKKDPERLARLSRTELDEYIFDIGYDFQLVGLPSVEERIREFHEFPELASLLRRLEMVYMARVAERFRSPERYTTPEELAKANLLPCDLDEPSYEIEMANVAMHAYRVARLVKLLGARLGLSRGQLSRLILAALLHDVGKGEYIEIITKPGALTLEDWEKVDRHAHRSFELIKKQLEKMRQEEAWGADEVNVRFTADVAALLDPLTLGEIEAHHSDLRKSDDIGLHILTACDNLDALLDLSRLYHGGHPKSFELVCDILQEKKHVSPVVMAEILALASADAATDPDARTFSTILMNTEQFLQLYYGVTLAARLKNDALLSDTDTANGAIETPFDRTRLQCRNAIVDSNLSLDTKVELVGRIDEFALVVLDSPMSDFVRNDGDSPIALEEIITEAPILIYDATQRFDISTSTKEDIAAGMPVVLKGSDTDLDRVIASLREDVGAERLRSVYRLEMDAEHIALTSVVAPGADATVEAVVTGRSPVLVAVAVVSALVLAIFGFAGGKGLSFRYLALAIIVHELTHLAFAIGTHIANTGRFPRIGIGFWSRVQEPSEEHPVVINILPRGNGFSMPLVAVDVYADTVDENRVRLSAPLIGMLLSLPLLFISGQLASTFFILNGLSLLKGDSHVLDNAFEPSRASFEDRRGFLIAAGIVGGGAVVGSAAMQLVPAHYGKFTKAVSTAYATVTQHKFPEKTFIKKIVLLYWLQKYKSTLEAEQGGYYYKDLNEHGEEQWHMVRTSQGDRDSIQVSDYGTDKPIIGYWHSHPYGSSRFVQMPSQADLVKILTDTEHESAIVLAPNDIVILRNRKTQVRSPLATLMLEANERINTLLAQEQLSPEARSDRRSKLIEQLVQTFVVDQFPNLKEFSSSTQGMGRAYTLASWKFVAHALGIECEAYSWPDPENWASWDFSETPQRDQWVEGVVAKGDTLLEVFRGLVRNGEFDALVRGERTLGTIRVEEEKQQQAPAPKKEAAPRETPKKEKTAPKKKSDAPKDGKKRPGATSAPRKRAAATTALGAYFLKKNAPGSAGRDFVSEDMPSIAFIFQEGMWVPYTLNADQHRIINEVWGEMWNRGFEMPADASIAQDVGDILSYCGIESPLHIYVPPDNLFFNLVRIAAHRDGVVFPPDGQWQLVTHPGTYRTADGNSRSCNLLIPRNQWGVIATLRDRDPAAYSEWLQHEVAHIVDRFNKARGAEQNEEAIAARHTTFNFILAYNRMKALSIRERKMSGDEGLILYHEIREGRFPGMIGHNLQRLCIASDVAAEDFDFYTSSGIWNEMRLRHIEDRIFAGIRLGKPLEAVTENEQIDAIIRNKVQLATFATAIPGSALTDDDERSRNFLYMTTEYYSTNLASHLAKIRYAIEHRRRPDIAALTALVFIAQEFRKASDGAQRRGKRISVRQCAANALVNDLERRGIASAAEFYTAMHLQGPNGAAWALSFLNEIYDSHFVPLAERRDLITARAPIASEPSAVSPELVPKENFGSLVATHRVLVDPHEDERLRRMMTVDIYSRAVSGEPYTYTLTARSEEESLASLTYVTEDPTIVYITQNNFSTSRGDISELLMQALIQKARATGKTKVRVVYDVVTGQENVLHQQWGQKFRTPCTTLLSDPSITIFEYDIMPAPQSTIAGTVQAAVAADIATFISVPFACFGVLPYTVTIGLAVTALALFIHASVGQISLGQRTPEQARAPDSLTTATDELAHFTDIPTWLSDIREAVRTHQFNKLFALVTHEPFHVVSRSNIFAYTMQVISIAVAAIVLVHYLGAVPLAAAGVASFAMALRPVSLLVPEQHTSALYVAGQSDIDIMTTIIKRFQEVNTFVLVDKQYRNADGSTGESFERLIEKLIARGFNINRAQLEFDAHGRLEFTIHPPADLCMGNSARLIRFVVFGRDFFDETVPLTAECGNGFMVSVVKFPGTAGYMSRAVGGDGTRFYNRLLSLTADNGFVYIRHAFLPTQEQIDRFNMAIVEDTRGTSAIQYATGLDVNVDEHVLLVKRTAAAVPVRGLSKEEHPADTDIGHDAPPALGRLDAGPSPEELVRLREEMLRGIVHNEDGLMQSDELQGVSSHPSVGSTEGYVNEAILHAHTQLMVGNASVGEAAEIIIGALARMEEPEYLVNIHIAINIIRAANEARYAPVLEILERYAVLTDHVPLRAEVQDALARLEQSPPTSAPTVTVVELGRVPDDLMKALIDEHEGRLEAILADLRDNHHINTSMSSLVRYITMRDDLKAHAAAARVGRSKKFWPVGRVLKALLERTRRGAKNTAKALREGPDRDWALIDAARHARVELPKEEMYPDRLTVLTEIDAYRVAGRLWTQALRKAARRFGIPPPSIEPDHVLTDKFGRLGFYKRQWAVSPHCSGNVTIERKNALTAQLVDCNNKDNWIKFEGNGTQVTISLPAFRARPAQQLTITVSTYPAGETIDLVEEPIMAEFILRLFWMRHPQEPLTTAVMQEIRAQHAGEASNRQRWHMWQGVILQFPRLYEESSVVRYYRDMPRRAHFFALENREHPEQFLVFMKGSNGFCILADTPEADTHLRIRAHRINPIGTKAFTAFDVAIPRKVYTQQVSGSALASLGQAAVHVNTAIPMTLTRRDGVSLRTEEWERDTIAFTDAITNNEICTITRVGYDEFTISGFADPRGVPVVVKTNYLNISTLVHAFPQYASDLLRRCFNPTNETAYGRKPEDVVRYELQGATVVRVGYGPIGHLLRSMKLRAWQKRFLFYPELVGRIEYIRVTENDEDCLLLIDIKKRNNTCRIIMAQDGSLILRTRDRQRDAFIETPLAQTGEVVSLRRYQAFIDFRDSVLDIPPSGPGKRQRMMYWLQREGAFSVLNHSNPTFGGVVLTLPNYYGDHPGAVYTYRDTESDSHWLALVSSSDTTAYIVFEYRNGVVSIVTEEGELPLTNRTDAGGIALLRETNFQEFDHHVERPSRRRTLERRSPKFSIGDVGISFTAGDWFDIERRAGNVRRPDEYQQEAVRLIRRATGIAVTEITRRGEREFTIQGVTLPDGSPAIIEADYINISTIVHGFAHSPFVHVDPILTSNFSPTPVDVNERTDLVRYAYNHARRRIVRVDNEIPITPPSAGSTEGDVNEAILFAYRGVATDRPDVAQAAAIIIDALRTMTEPEYIVNIQTAIDIIRAANNPQYAPVLEILERYAALTDHTNLREEVQAALARLEKSPPAIGPAKRHADEATLGAHGGMNASSDMPHQAQDDDYAVIIEELAKRGIPFKGRIDVTASPQNTMNIVWCNLEKNFERNAIIFKYLNSLLSTPDSGVMLTIAGRDDLEIRQAGERQGRVFVHRGLLIRDGSLYLATFSSPVIAHCIVRPPTEWHLRLEKMGIPTIPSSSSLHSVSAIKSRQHELLQPLGVPIPDLLAIIPYIYDDRDVEDTITDMLKLLSQRGVTAVCVKPNSGSHGRNTFVLDPRTADAVPILRALERENGPLIIERFVESIPVSLDSSVPAYLLPGAELFKQDHPIEWQHLRNCVRFIVAKNADGSWSVDSKTARLGWPVISSTTEMAYLFFEDFLKGIHFEGQPVFTADEQKHIDEKMEKIALTIVKSVFSNMPDTPLIAVDFIISNEIDTDGLPKCYVNETASDFTMADGIEMRMKALGRESEEQKYFRYLEKLFDYMYTAARAYKDRIDRNIITPPSAGSTEGDVNEAILFAYRGVATDRPDIVQAAAIIIDALRTMTEPEYIVNIQTAIDIIRAADNPQYAPVLEILERYAALTDHTNLREEVQAALARLGQPPSRAIVAIDRITSATDGLLRWSRTSPDMRALMDVQPVWNADDAQLGKEDRFGGTITLTPRVALRLFASVSSEDIAPVLGPIFREAIRQNAGINAGAPTWKFIERIAATASAEARASLVQEFLGLTDTQRSAIIETVRLYHNAMLLILCEIGIARLAAGGTHDVDYAAPAALFGKNLTVFLAYVAKRWEGRQTEISMLLEQLVTELLLANKFGFTLPSPDVIPVEKIIRKRDDLDALTLGRRGTLRVASTPDLLYPVSNKLWTILPQPFAEGFRELFFNAMEHGNHFMADKIVTISWEINDSRIQVIVEDEGSDSFDAATYVHMTTDQVEDRRQRQLELIDADELRPHTKSGSGLGIWIAGDFSDEIYFEELRDASGQKQGTRAMIVKNIKQKHAPVSQAIKITQPSAGSTEGDTNEAILRAHSMLAHVQYRPDCDVITADDLDFTGKSLVMHTGRYCNRQCAICSLDALHLATGEEMDPRNVMSDETRQQLVAQMPAWHTNQLYVCGEGEPFLNFWTLLKTVAEAPVYQISIATNGFWGATESDLRYYLAELERAADANPKLTQLTIMLSADAWHHNMREAVTIIDAMMERQEDRLGSSKLRCSVFATFSPDFANYRTAFIGALQQRGITFLAQEYYAGTDTVLIAALKRGSTTIPWSAFPPAPIGRSAMQYRTFDDLTRTMTGEPQLISFADYTPDGKIGDTDDSALCRYDGTLVTYVGVHPLLGSGTLTMSMDERLRVANNNPFLRAIKEGRMKEILEHVGHIRPELLNAIPRDVTDIRIMARLLQQGDDVARYILDYILAQDRARGMLVEEAQVTPPAVGSTEGHVNGAILQAHNTLLSQARSSVGTQAEGPRFLSMPGMGGGNVAPTASAFGTAVPATAALLPGAQEAIALGADAASVAQAEYAAVALHCPLGIEIETMQAQDCSDGTLSFNGTTDYVDGDGKYPEGDQLLYGTVDDFQYFTYYEYRSRPSWSTASQAAIVEGLRQRGFDPASFISVHTNAGVFKGSLTREEQEQILDDANYLLLALVLLYVRDEVIQLRKTRRTVAYHEDACESINGIPAKRIEYTFGDIEDIEHISRAIQRLHPAICAFHLQGQVDTPLYPDYLRTIYASAFLPLERVMTELKLPQQFDIRNALTYWSLIDWRRTHPDEVARVRRALREAITSADETIAQASTAPAQSSTAKEYKPGWHADLASRVAVYDMTRDSNGRIVVKGEDELDRHHTPWRNLEPGKITVSEGEIVIAELREGEEIVTDRLITCAAFMGYGRMRDGKQVCILSHLVSDERKPEILQQQLDLLPYILAQENIVALEYYFDATRDDAPAIRQYAQELSPRLAGASVHTDMKQYAWRPHAEDANGIRGNIVINRDGYVCKHINEATKQVEARHVWPWTYAAPQTPQLAVRYQVIGVIAGTIFGTLAGIGQDWISGSLQALAISIIALLVGWAIHEIGHSIGKPYGDAIHIRAGPIASALLFIVTVLTAQYFQHTDQTFSTIAAIAAVNYLVHIFADEEVLIKDLFGQSAIQQNLQPALAGVGQVSPVSPSVAMMASADGGMEGASPVSPPRMSPEIREWAVPPYVNHEFTDYVEIDGLMDYVRSVSGMTLGQEYLRHRLANPYLDVAQIYAAYKEQYDFVLSNEDALRELGATLKEFDAMVIAAYPGYDSIVPAQIPDSATLTNMLQRLRRAIADERVYISATVRQEALKFLDVAIGQVPTFVESEMLKGAIGAVSTTGIGDIAGIYTLAMLRRDAHFKDARFETGDTLLQISDIVNPALKTRGIPVPMSLTIHNDKKVTVISGLNKGGKSFVMKTAGLCALMAQAGLPVPGDVVMNQEHLFSAYLKPTVSVKDTMVGIGSQWSAELTKTQEAFDHTLPDSFVVVDDDVFGASTEEVVAAAFLCGAIEETASRGAVMLVASHHLDALKLLRARNRNAFRFLQVVTDRDARGFSTSRFRFDEGIAASSYGIELTASMHWPAIEKAVAYFNRLTARYGKEPIAPLPIAPTPADLSSSASMQRANAKIRSAEADSIFDLLCIRGYVAPLDDEEVFLAAEFLREATRSPETVDGALWRNALQALTARPDLLHTFEECLRNALTATESKEAQRQATEALLAFCRGSSITLLTQCAHTMDLFLANNPDAEYAYRVKSIVPHMFFGSTGDEFKEYGKTIGSLYALRMLAHLPIDEKNTWSISTVESAPGIVDIHDGWHTNLVDIPRDKLHTHSVTITPSPGRGSLSIYTGFNTGGKSTLARMIVQAALLTKMGWPVPAQYARISEFSDIRMLTRSVMDNARQRAGREGERVSESSLEELLRESSAMIRDAKPGMLAVLDEPFSGCTEPTVAAALTAALADELTRKGATVILITHFLDMVPLVQEAVPDAQCWKAVTHMEEEGIAADYAFVPGVAASSHGIEIARKMQWFAYDRAAEYFQVFQRQRHHDAGVQSVLELGVGSWPYVEALSKRFPRATIVGIDMHEMAVEELRQWLRSANLGARITAVAGHVATLDAVPGIEGRTFDRVLMVNPEVFTDLQRLFSLLLEVDTVPDGVEVAADTHTLAAIFAGINNRLNEGGQLEIFMSELHVQYYLPSVVRQSMEAVGAEPVWLAAGGHFAHLNCAGVLYVLSKEQVRMLGERLAAGIGAPDIAPPSVGSTQGYVNEAILRTHKELTQGNVPPEEAARSIIDALHTMAEPEYIVNIQTAIDIIAAAENPHYAPVLEILQRYAALTDHTNLREDIQMQMDKTADMQLSTRTAGDGWMNFKNATSFFRHVGSSIQKNAFDLFIHALAEEARKSGGVRILAAGCSTGEEAYTLAMALAEEGIPLSAIHIVGVDADPSLIGIAQEGTYAVRSESFGTLLPDTPMFRRYFTTTNNGLCRVSDEIRKAVEFKTCDLMDAAAMVALGTFNGIVLNYVEYQVIPAQRHALYQNLAMIADDQAFLLTSGDQLGRNIFVRAASSQTGFRVHALDARIRSHVLYPRGAAAQVHAALDAAALPAAEKVQHAKASLEAIRDAGAVLLGDLTSRKIMANDGAASGTPRSIPINVDIFDGIPEGNSDIIERFMEILALKQLEINRRSKAVSFRLISRSNNQALVDRVTAIYNNLSTVTNYHLKLNGDATLRPGFTLTHAGDDVSAYSERCTFLEKKVEANDTESGLCQWAGVIDLTVSLTLLLDHTAESRANYYARVAALYGKLLEDPARVADPNIFADFFDDNVRTSQSLAKRLAIPLCGKYSIDELRELYIYMRGVIEAA